MTGRRGLRARAGRHRIRRVLAPRRLARWFVLTTAGRLFGAAAGTAVALVALGVIAVGSFEDLAERTDRLVTEQVRPLVLLGDVQSATERLQRRAVVYVHAPAASRITAGIALQQDLTGLEEAVEAYAAAAVDDEGRTGLVSSARTRIAAIRALVTDQLAPAVEAERRDDALRVLNTEIDPLTAMLQRSIDGLEEIETEASDEAVAATRAIADDERRRLAALAGGIALMAVTAGALLSRRVGVPMSTAVRVLERARGGDLTVSAGLRGRDEIAGMGQSLDGLVTSLRVAISEIDGQARSLERASVEMEQLSQRFTDAASSTSSTLHGASTGVDQVRTSADAVTAQATEMHATIQALSSRVGEATGSTRAAVQAAEDSDATISELGRSSDRVGDIIRQVEDIAQQTNLLALNATIEAARAGEAGKGFAVVAGEVKDLAQETARAAQDIATRIEAMRTGADGAVHAIGRIRTAVDQVDATQEAIAAGMAQQAASTRTIEELARGSASAVTDVERRIGDAVDHAARTAQAADEARRTATALARIGAELAEVVSRFATGTDA